MTPVFRIQTPTKDITEAVRDRLIDIAVQDEAGWRADELEIRLDDRGGALALPDIGTALTVEMGYREIGLAPMGVFKVDEIDFDGWPQTLSVKATAVDMSAALKSRRTVAWDIISLADIVARIAASHGLEPRVSPDLSFEYEHVDQTNESDFHFLTRLAVDHDAVASVKGGRLLFLSRGVASTASGKPIPAIQIDASRITRYHVVRAERGKYKSTRASWHDVASGERLTLEYGEGAPVFELRHVYQSKSAATRAARSKLASLERSSDTASISLEGDTALAAEVPIILTGIRDKVDGSWTIASASHTMTTSGYQVTIECEAGEGQASE